MGCGHTPTSPRDHVNQFDVVEGAILQRLVHVFVLQKEQRGRGDSGQGGLLSHNQQRLYKEKKTRFSGRKNSGLFSLYLLNTRLEVQQGL